MAFFILVSVVCFDMDVEASDKNTFYVPYAEPSTSDTQGYIAVMYEYVDTLERIISVYSWSISASNGNLESEIPYINVRVNNDAFELKGYSSSSNVVMSMSVVLLNEYNQIGVVYSDPSTTAPYYRVAYGGLRIAGYYVKGNTTLVQQLGSSRMEVPQIVWGGDSAIVDSVRDLLAEMQKNNTLTQEAVDLLNTSLKQNSSDKGVIDDFKGNSNSQSNSINNLNQQNKVDKIDVDSASGTIDGYIDSNVISNYGVLLSTFTTNEHVLQFILVVLAVGLVSYVLFGKR